MTRTEYMKQLQEHLRNFTPDTQQEILEDYNQHFEEGLANGKSEEQIIADLGSIDDMIRELSQDQKQELSVPSNENASYSGAYHSVVLDGAIADVHVEASTDNCIHVDYQNNGNEAQQAKYRFYQYEKDNVFYAGVMDNGLETSNQESKSFRLFGIPLFSYNGFSIHNGSIILTVKLPESVETLNVKTGSGNIRITGITPQILQTVTGSGDTILCDTICKQLDTHAGSGNISLSDIAFDTASSHTGSGNITGKTALTKASGSFSGHTGSGNIRLQAAIGSCQLQTGSGNISLHSEHSLQSSQLQTGSGNISVVLENADGMEVNVKSNSGNARLSWKAEPTQHVKSGNFNFGNGEVKMHTRTGSGNIEIIGK